MNDRFDHTLEHTLKTKPDETDDASSGFRRIELITGVGRRRRWSSDEKARILVESLKPGANISEVARRNGLSPQQLFGWRREVREPDPAAPHPSPAGKRGRSKAIRGGAPGPDTAPTHFAPIVIAAPVAPPALPPPPPTGGSPGSIEIAIGDAVVRVRGQVDMVLLAAVLRAVRRAA